ncbi:hypothetical protein EIN_428050 [Entamoeba invadens IP1]|uniref:Selenoprotein F/M domain-containing protein n=1 Tax=Entamoeba invadens IP1 TaxID=370355 RepID=A0A0A1UGT2_ENTIV|nr:hypothetical protein EIN_428050 [Entamoeba invadens IP1]ELP95129.1 hypothetical protein EIN_428050 [Entamoeba invadens IP1]|eukprot:XP_004261900.1 hypothetical protein EIN_428050 [Entamoeba invadens IP1]
MIVFLGLVLLGAYAANQDKYFKAVIEMRIRCTRGEGVGEFIVDEISNYPMTIFVTNQENADYLTFQDVMGNPLEKMDISNSTMEQIAQELETRGYRQYYKQ